MGEEKTLWWHHNNPTYPSATTGNVKPMAIGGRLVRERERLQGMSKAERAWRAQWLKDQILTEREPIVVDSLKNHFKNPIRKAYQLPLDCLYKTLAPALGDSKAYALRFWLGKAAIGFTGMWCGVYYFYYNRNDWTRRGGWNVYHSRSQCVPGDEGYPKLSDRSLPQHYADRGFSKSPI